jgi:hypothetical protein
MAVRRARTAALSRMFDILRFTGKASVPAKGGALVPRVLFVSEQKSQFERLR